MTFEEAKALLKEISQGLNDYGLHTKVWVEDRHLGYGHFRKAVVMTGEVTAQWTRLNAETDQIVFLQFEQEDWGPTSLVATKAKHPRWYSADQAVEKIAELMTRETVYG